ncbi:transcriptional regulator [Verrucomicrobiota bacterium]|nr:transcriptional regulator [Verrucomicrobiota bacterium]
MLNKRLTKSLYTKEWEVLLELLRDLREAQGWTQEQLAKKLGRPQSTVSKIEAGERKLDVCQFVDYLRILNADPVAAMRRLMKAIQKR